MHLAAARGRAHWPPQERMDAPPADAPLISTRRNASADAAPPQRAAPPASSPPARLGGGPRFTRRKGVRCDAGAATLTTIPETANADESGADSRWAARPAAASLRAASAAGPLHAAVAAADVALRGPGARSVERHGGSAAETHVPTEPSRKRPRHDAASARMAELAAFFREVRAPKRAAAARCVTRPVCFGRGIPCVACCSQRLHHPGG
jgi:hypothetical protein